MKIGSIALLAVMLLVSALLLIGCGLGGSLSDSTVIRTTYVDSEGMTVVLEAGKLDSGYGLVSNDVTMRLSKSKHTSMPVIVVNGGDEVRRFRADISVPSDVSAGYRALPEEYLSWFSIVQPDSDTNRDSFCMIPVNIQVPAEYTPGSYQINVRATADQGTFIQLAYQMPWYLEVK